jgi:hypothetical protein
VDIDRYKDLSMISYLNFMFKPQVGTENFIVYMAEKAGTSE